MERSPGTQGGWGPSWKSHQSQEDAGLAGGPARAWGSQHRSAGQGSPAPFRHWVPGFESPLVESTWNVTPGLGNLSLSCKMWCPLTVTQCAWLTPNPKIFQGKTLHPWRGASFTLQPSVPSALRTWLLSITLWASLHERPFTGGFLNPVHPSVCISFSIHQMGTADLILLLHWVILKA